MKRRDFIAGSLAAGAAGAVGGAMAGASSVAAQETAPAAPAAKLTTYIVDPAAPFQGWIRRGTDPLVGYRAFPEQKFPCFFPLAGPVTGKSLTTETDEEYPHHRSLWLATDHILLDGGKTRHMNWAGANREGQIVSEGIAFTGNTGDRVTLTDRTLWRSPGREKPYLEDRRRFTLRLVPGKPDWFIDAEVTLTAMEDFRIGRSNHSFFSLRAARDLTPSRGGKLVNAEGVSGEKATFGKPSRWMAFFGKRTATDVTEGIAMMVHPKYPDTDRFPAFRDCPWFTRDYGFLSPTPMNFFDTPLTLAAGESVTFRWRVVAFAGTPEEAGLDALCDDFYIPPTPSDGVRSG